MLPLYQLPSFCFPARGRGPWAETLPSTLRIRVPQTEVADHSNYLPLLRTHYHIRKSADIIISLLKVCQSTAFSISYTVKPSVPGVICTALHSSAPIPYYSLTRALGPAVYNANCSFFWPFALSFQSDVAWSTHAAFITSELKPFLPPLCVKYVNNKFITHCTKPSLCQEMHIP